MAHSLQLFLHRKTLFMVLFSRARFDGFYVSFQNVVRAPSS